MKKIYLSTLLLAVSVSLFAQGSFSGDLLMNTNFYQRDSLIGAFSTPQYDRQLSSTDAWLSLSYSNHGFIFGLRFDLFNNTNLYDPSGSYTGMGIGAWSISKKIKELEITGGYIYDQYGSGITFRAYEERLLGIDQSVLGIKLVYDINENWRLKGFTGKQKNRFETFDPIMKGGSIEGSIKLGESLSILPGASLVNRTLDDASMQLIVSSINAFPDPEDRFIPKYNVFAYSGFFTMNWKSLSWFAEYAGKTNEAIVAQSGDLEDRDGQVIYTSLTFSQKGFGITGQFKRTEDYTLRTSPNQVLLDGVIDFLPPMARQNTYRLTARYAPATQDLAEMAYQVDIFWTPKKGYTFSLNYADIQDLSQTQLYREVYLDFLYKKKKKWNATIGTQYMEYNQDFYQIKPGVPNIISIVPFVEYTYKITRRKSIRAEAHYQATKQDFGSFIYALIEYNRAPRWSIGISDMWNYDPKKTTEKVHYYSGYVAYNKGANRFMLNYVKQVEGVVCAGGVCRFEPAFSGLKFSISSSF